MGDLFVTVSCKEGCVNEENFSLRKFTLEAVYISSLYSKYLKDVEIKNLRRITIELVDKPKKISIRPPLPLIKVCIIEQFFDFENYFSEEDINERYKIILGLMNASIVLACQKFGWDKKAFENAYERVLKSNFEFRFRLGEKVPSNDRTLLAFVNVDVKLKYAIISVVVRDVSSDQLINKIEILKINPIEIDNQDLFKNLKWISDNEIAIFNVTGEIGFRTSLKTSNSELVLKPNKHSEAYLLDELKLIDPATSAEEHEEIFSRRYGKI